jgi:hypothetical protein
MKECINGFEEGRIRLLSSGQTAHREDYLRRIPDDRDASLGKFVRKVV